MKKITLALVFVFLITLFAGCSMEGSLSEDQVLSVRNRNNGKVINIGDDEKTVQSIAGKNEEDGHEFDDGVTRISYWDTPGVDFDYREGKLVAITLNEDSRYETVEKLYVGMDEKDAREILSKNKNAVEGLSGGVLLGYDKDKNPIKFSEDAPYYRVVSFKDSKVSMIVLQDNF